MPSAFDLFQAYLTYVIMHRRNAVSVITQLKLAKPSLPQTTHELSCGAACVPHE